MNMRQSCAAVMMIIVCIRTLSANAATESHPGYINPFAAFNFGIQDRPAQAQINLLQKLGYQGMAIAVSNDRNAINELRAYTQVPQIKNGQFKIYAVLWWTIAKNGYDRAFLEKMLIETAKMRAALWVVVDGNHLQEIDATLRLLNAAADQCAAHGVEMVLYPHGGTIFQDTDEALAIRTLLNRPEIKVSLHVCHELKAGKMRQLAETAKKAAPYLSLVTISGANTAAVLKDDGWDDTILPLDKGDLDLRPLVTALKEVHYTGPVILHTYGIKDAPEDHLQRSRTWWKKLEASIKDEIRKN